MGAPALALALALATLVRESGAAECGANASPSAGGGCECSEGFLTSGWAEHAAQVCADEDVVEGIFGEKLQHCLAVCYANPECGFVAWSEVSTGPDLPHALSCYLHRGCELRSGPLGTVVYDKTGGDVSCKPIPPEPTPPARVGTGVYLLVVLCLMLALGLVWSLIHEWRRHHRPSDEERFSGVDLRAPGPNLG